VERNGTGDQIEPETKWIDGESRAGHEIRQMTWSERDRADEDGLEQQKRARKIGHMKSRRSLGDQ
jgi:hypothetical protein